MALPKDRNDYTTRREVRDFPVGDTRAATIRYSQYTSPIVRFRKIIRVTKTMVITEDNRGGEVKWSLGKHDLDFQQVGTRDGWKSTCLYPPGDPRVAEALAQRQEWDRQQDRANKIAEAIKPLQPTPFSGRLGPSDDTLRAVIAELTALLPAE